MTALTPRSLDFYLNLKYAITAHPDGREGYFVEIKDLPNCVSFASSWEEALVNINEARIAWIKKAYGHENIPFPS